jgi:hypothetical protein
MKKKRKRKYDPCRCGLWAFPHRPDKSWCLLQEYQRRAVIKDMYPERPRG